MQTENLSLQKELVRTMQQKRAVLGDMEKENLDFGEKFEGKARDKAQMR